MIVSHTYMCPHVYSFPTEPMCTLHAVHYSHLPTLRRVCLHMCTHSVQKECLGTHTGWRRYMYQPTSLFPYYRPAHTHTHTPCLQTNIHIFTNAKNQVHKCVRLEHTNAQTLRPVCTHTGHTLSIESTHLQCQLPTAGGGLQSWWGPVKAGCGHLDSHHLL